MINTKRPNTDDYTQVGFIEAKDNQGNYQNIDHIYDSEGNIVFQQGYLNEYDGADDFSIPAIGKPLIDYTIYGNTFQDGIPTPDNPIMPEGTGERTGNLAKYWKPAYVSSNGLVKPNSVNGISFPVKLEAEQTVTFTNQKTNFGRGIAIFSEFDGENFTNMLYRSTNNTTTYTADSDCYVIIWGNYDNTTSMDESVFVLCGQMLNFGSEALPYEPYGYKIPIMAGKYEFLEEPLRAVKTYKDTIDLSTKLLTRRVKELVLTGEENWTYEPQYSRFVLICPDAYYSGTVRTTPCNCSHYQPIYDGRTIDNVPNESIYVTTSSGKTAFDIKLTDFSGVTNFKSYLTSQYAAGTPVTIWYVLTEPITETMSIPSSLTGIIEGICIQDGTPTPDNPIMPVGRGKRTENLSVPLTEWEDGYLNSNGNIAAANPTRLEKASGFIEITNKETLTFSYPNGFPSLNHDNGWRAMCFYTADKTHITRTDPTENYGETPLVVDIPANAKYVRLSFRTFGQTDNAMLNTGSTPLPYEPYGYKLNILSGGAATPIYLGEVESTRKIRKLVLTGEEGTAFYNKNSTSANNSLYYIRFPALQSAPLNGSPLYCTHLQNLDYTPSGVVGINVGTAYNVLYFNLGLDVMNAQPSGNTITGLKEYLAAQYANGTPITIWYVLETPETAVVNESLMKVGNYADTLSMEQAGVDIPTLKRPNTTEIDITTSLPPSEVYAKYRGSKTQKYDLFLAANGDSFEAKNGQSLYIGDDA